MQTDQRYLALNTFVEPARASSEPWRFLLGLLMIVALGLVFSFAFTKLLGGLLSPDAFTAFIEFTADGPGRVLALLLGFAFFLISTLVVTDLLHHRSAIGLFGQPKLMVWQCIYVLTGLVPLNVVVSILPPWNGPNLLSGQSFSTWIFLLPFALVAIMVQVLTEEVLFRGYILQQLAARFRHPIVWMVLPSAFFAALHYDPNSGSSTIWIMVSVLLFGILASDLTARSGTLGPAIALHFANNVTALLVIAPQNDLDALALYRWPFDMTDTAVLREAVMIDAAFLLCAWLVARLVLRR